MQEKDFVSYEYATKTVKTKNKCKAVDLYEAFGWEITGTAAGINDSVTLSLKRDRKQKHKKELTKLERQAEEAFELIDRLNASKTLGASVFSYIFGCLATLILGGGMCMTMLIENNPAAFAGGIILGVLGIALCCANYFIYKKIAEKKTKQVLPVIDETEEKLADICENGNELLKAEII